jgi:hypothetical protein
MGTQYLLSVFLAMIFFQVLYVFEEIRNEAYTEMGSLNTYLLSASFLIFLYFFPLLIIILEMRWGTYVAFLPTLLSIGNGGAHLFRLIKDKELRKNWIMGVFLGGSLILSGILTFLGLLANL